MIDENCYIWKQGIGMCKVPLEGWGMSEEEVCKACMLKHLTCRYCGKTESDALQGCNLKHCKSVSVIPIRLVKSA